MNPLRALILAIALTAVPTTAALAQMDATDSKYQEERRSARSNRGMFKLIGAGVVAIIAAGGWVVKKVKGE